MQTEILLPHEYPLWDDLVTESPHGTIFHYSWWLDATGFKFRILAAKDELGNFVGGIPLPYKKRAGLLLLHSPKLTPYLGPIFKFSDTTPVHAWHSVMRRVGEALAKGIRGFDSMSYWVGPAGPDLQGFLWQGFTATLNYTFRFEAGTTMEQIKGRMASNHQYELRKAQRLGTRIETSEDIEVLLEMNRKTFLRQGARLPFTEDLPRRLVRAAISRGLAKIYLARNSKGAPAATVLVVNDRRTSYQLMAGGDPDLRVTGAGNLAEWQALRDALSAGRIFDFEGSHLRGVEQHYRHWGATPTPFMGLEKAGTLKGALARLWVGRRRYFS